PLLEPDLDLRRTLDTALLALGRLDGISAFLPDPDVFLYTYVRKEAVLSSQIEGTQSSLSDLLLSELDEAPGVPLDDVTEVSNYVAALDHGLTRLRGGFPFSTACSARCTASCCARVAALRRGPESSVAHRTGSAAAVREAPCSCRRRPNA